MSGKHARKHSCDDGSGVVWWVGCAYAVFPASHAIFCLKYRGNKIFWYVFCPLTRTACSLAA